MAELWTPHGDEQPAAGDGPQLDSNQLIAVCKYYYNRCAEDLGLDVTDLTAIDMRTFVGWCAGKDLPRAEADEMDLRLRVPKEQCDLITGVFQGDPWQCAAILYPIWYIVRLNHRPPHRNELAWIHVAITVGFRDGKNALIAGGKQYEEKMATTDGFQLSLMQDMINNSLAQIAEIGLDEMHDQHALMPGERQSMPGAL